MIRVGKDILLDATAGIIYKDQYIFSERDSNGIYAYNLSNHSTSLLVELENEPLYMDYLFTKMLILGEDLYLIPGTARSLYRVDLGTLDITAFEIEIQSLKENPFLAKFASVHLAENKIFMFGAKYPIIVIFDCNTELLRTIELDYFKAVNFFDVHTFVRRTLMLDDSILFSSSKKNCIGLINVISETIEYKEVGDESASFCAACRGTGENVYLCPQKGNYVLRWNRATDEYEKIEIPSEDMNVEYPYSDSMFIDGVVYLFPQFTKGISKLISVDGKWKWEKEIEDVSEIPDFLVNENKIVFHSRSTHKLYFYDSETGLESTVQLLMPEEESGKHQNFEDGKSTYSLHVHYYYNPYPVYESATGLFKQFVDMLVDSIGE